MTRLILDAGFFIGFERRGEHVMALLRAAQESRTQLVTSAPVVGQVWRNGRRQTELARLLRSVDVRVATDESAREAGLLLGNSGTKDVIDALLANLCLTTDVLLTSDPIDLKLLTDTNKSRPTIVAV
jgi:PIN domain